LPVNETNAHRPAVVELDGSMVHCKTAWREVKLLSVGVVGTTDRTYLAELKDSTRLEELLRHSPGFSALQKREVLWVADGSAYNWGVQKRLCPKARGLLDFYHVMEHAIGCAKVVLDQDSACVELFRSRVSHLLLSGEVELFFDELKECIPYKPKTKRDRRDAKELGAFFKYLQSHRTRLAYREFLDQGWPIGSGAIESAHKHVIQTRMKQAGMRWSEDGAQHMATLRALYASTTPENFPKLLNAA